MSSNLLMIHIIIGPLLLIISLLYKAFQPKKANMLYGYRTSRSMKTEHTWRVANEMSANLMMWGSIITIAFQALFYFLLEPEASVLASCGVLTVLIVGQILIVEKHLKENFDKEGNPL